MLTDTGVISPTQTELRIYPSFTEVRQEYDAPQNFKMYFPRDVFANIARGSLSIEGIPITTKQVISKANNLENQTVFVRHHPESEPQECCVIQGDDLLVQDVTTKRYFRAQRHEIEYVTIPEQEGTEVTYVLKNQGKATLSYQIHGISWSPQYELNILSDDGQHTFQAFADITNGTKQEYIINRTELFGGDVHLEGDCDKVRRRGRSRSRSRSQSVSDDEDELEVDLADCDVLPTVDTVGELAGLYLYSINQPFTLLPKSTFGLPFINATIQLKRFVGLSIVFTSQPQTRKLQRKYQIESIDKFLPGGPLTIREQGRLVGVTSLPDMAIGDKHILTSGQDPDVSLNRQVKLILKERHSSVYTVHLTFKNVKSTPVRVEYKEMINSRRGQCKIVPKGSDDQQAQIQVTNNGVEIYQRDTTDDHQITLAANGGELVFEYEIHLSYPQKKQSNWKRRRET